MRSWLHDVNADHARGRRGSGQHAAATDPHSWATPPGIRAQLVREGARWHRDSGEEGDAPSGAERIGTGDFATMRLRASVIAISDTGRR
jgi:hypothetical protein